MKGFISYTSTYHPILFLKQTTVLIPATLQPFHPRSVYVYSPKAVGLKSLGFMYDNFVLYDQSNMTVIFGRYTLCQHTNVKHIFLSLCAEKDKSGI